jgi:hypothetical protein
MKLLFITTLALTVGVTLAVTQVVAVQQDAPVAVQENDDLSDLNAMTFGCPKAALNAAARRAASVPSQGTYQFSYFKIINDAHHASYEVHFKSNYEGEADLRYCVEMYCQQGWDPATAAPSVTLLSNQRPGVTAHGAACGGHTPTPTTRGVKR